LEIAGRFDGVTVFLQMDRPAPSTVQVERLPEDRLHASLREVDL